VSKSYEIGYWKQRVDPSPPFPAGYDAYRPFLRIELIVPSTGKTFSTIALADTGADDCTFPLSFLAPLGLDQTKLPMRTTVGLGGSMNDTFYANVRIKIRFPPTKDSETFETLAGFTAGMDKFGGGLLGQRGFFEAFRVVFDRKAHLLRMQRY